MKDRVPLYPGRVKLTPVAGQENTYDMVRADQPQQEGDPLNKATLYSDDTAASFDLGADSVPDQALKLLSRFHKGLGNEYVWEKIFQGYSESQISGVSAEFYRSNSYSPGDIGITIYDSISIDPSTGEISGNNPQTVTTNYEDIVSTGGGAFFGKYYKSSGDSVSQNAYTWYYIPNPSELYYYNGGPNPWVCVMKNAIAIESQLVEEKYGYVNSPNPDAYPPAVSDGFTYEPFGQIGARKHIIGTYTGNGVNGRFIDVGVTPIAVLVENSHGQRYNAYSSSISTLVYGALATTGFNAVDKDGNVALAVVENGFKVYTTGQAYTNQSGDYYTYIVFI